jgi:hypothetical protein
MHHVLGVCDYVAGFGLCIDCEGIGTCDALNAIATALRAAEARGREEAAKIAFELLYQKNPTPYQVASAIRSLNAPQSPLAICRQALRWRS